MHSVGVGMIGKLLIAGRLPRTRAEISKLTILFIIIRIFSTRARINHRFGLLSLLDRMPYQSISWISLQDG